MKRGDVYTAATGSGFGSKPRPVLILQADHLNHLPRIIVGGLSSEMGEEHSLRPRIAPTAENGLRVLCEFTPDFMMSVVRRKIDKHIGRLSAEDQLRVDRALMVFLGLAA